MDVTPEQFVRTWQTSDSSWEVGRKLGMSSQSALVRAMRYRLAGVKLKKHKRTAGQEIDVKRLNALCK